MVVQAAGSWGYVSREEMNASPEPEPCVICRMPFSEDAESSQLVAHNNASSASGLKHPVHLDCQRAWLIEGRHVSSLNGNKVKCESCQNLYDASRVSELSCDGLRVELDLSRIRSMSGILKASLIAQMIAGLYYSPFQWDRLFYHGLGVSGTALGTVGLIIIGSVAIGVEEEKNWADEEAVQIRGRAVAVALAAAVAVVVARAAGALGAGEEVAALVGVGAAEVAALAGAVAAGAGTVVAGAVAAGAGTVVAGSEEVAASVAVMISTNLLIWACLIGPSDLLETLKRVGSVARKACFA